ncbi:hypothetical protein Sste5346_003308 [Sporothrix stenoceras]|uniref:Pathway-specific nitrogen regulator n=1 Tax=Sporothrix stenoceras TaxID=5173 RepID=A0ABR3ZF23_9PEZI
MADDIVPDHNIAEHEEEAPEIILDKSTVEEATESTESTVTEDKDTLQSSADAGNSNDVANVIEAIDAFLADPNDLGEESQTEVQVEQEENDTHNESHAESLEASICESYSDDHDDSHIEEEGVKVEDEPATDNLTTTNAEEEQADDTTEAHTEEAVEEVAEESIEEASEQDNTPLVEIRPRDLSATVEDETPEELAEELAEQASHESTEPQGEERNVEEEHDESHMAEPFEEENVESHEESFAQSVDNSDDQSEHEHEEKADEVHEDHSIVEHDEADVSITESASSHGDESQHEHHDEDQAHDHEHHDDDENGETHEETQNDDNTSRRTSASSSRSAVSNISNRRTSLRTEALIQAAARAVVAKINEKGSTDSHFDIMRAMSESHESIMEEATEAEHHSTTDEEGENDHEGEAELDDDDVFSDRSPRSSLGSFEHNSGASNNGVDEHQKMNIHSTSDDATEHQESEDEHDYLEDTGSVTYHRETSHYSPRMSGVSGISRMSQYEQHQEDDDEEYNDGDDYAHHTIRGTPRAAFRTPSSVRAIQMSSPSPSVIFGVSPRSAARRRRLGTGSGLDDGQSMGSVGTYSSLPGSPSKNHTPTRFKVFRKPEPAPLVLLHATLMPTRWVWSDVLRTLDESISRSSSDRPSSRSPSSMGSPRKSRGKNDVSLHDEDAAETASFEPSAALKRLHGAWCQLQDYSLGADTVAERGVLLPHPQNDYEVLEERLLEALELPVRRRARILECGHYLGPADDEDDEDYEDEDGYYNERAEEDESSKRHWCTTCRSDIRYESLGAERVFRVKVYASNGLMTVGAWAACWSEMERVDVEIEPIVADPALLRELNQLRTQQQQEALRKQEEEDAAAEAAMHEEEEEEELHEEELLHEHEEHDNHDQQAEHEEHQVHDETARSPPAVDHFHLEVPSVIPVSPPLRDSPVEPPFITTTDHASDADRRRREAEDRLREIYGRTPPQMPHSAAPASHSHHVESTRLSDVPETVETATTRDMNDMNDNHSPYGPSPPSPSAEAYERREERRSRQFSSADRGFSNEPDVSAPHAHHPQAPYESASLPELLLAAVKVFLRDSKHVAITVLSIIVIVLATLRAPGGAGDQGTTHSVQSQAHGVQPAMGYSYQPVKGVSNGHIDVAQKPVEASSVVMSESSVVAEIASSAVAASVDTLVETVVEKMTVKVYETVTETSTETATQTTVATIATEEPVIDVSSTVIAETATVEAIESAVSEEPTSASVLAEPIVEEQKNTFETEVEVESSSATSAVSLPALVDASSFFAATDASTSAAKPTALVVEEHDEL